MYSALGSTVHWGFLQQLYSNVGVLEQGESQGIQSYSTTMSGDRGQGGAREREDGCGGGRREREKGVEGW